MALQDQNKETSVMNAITEVIQTGHLCVLSTLSGDRPYSSLMRYLADDRCTAIYLVMHKNTTKYQNLLQNSLVSLLIDTRTSAPLADIQALSIDGIAFPVADAARQASVREAFIARHPDMAEFVRQPDALMICVEIQGFLLLNGIQDAHRVRVKS
ncbi:MAG: pyridoxamine 5'-phosphate oxidase family protein [Desulfobacteraceae bacterium]|nr:MAG: pyridoxamine 5'-phosphate oxidase family protein [Desulfobacteraceae bacterium]